SLRAASTHPPTRSLSSSQPRSLKPGNFPQPPGSPHSAHSARSTQLLTPRNPPFCHLFLPFPSPPTHFPRLKGAVHALTSDLSCAGGQRAFIGPPGLASARAAAAARRF